MERPAAAARWGTPLALLAACTLGLAARADGAAAPGSTTPPSALPSPSAPEAEPISGPFQLFPLGALRYYFESDANGKGKAEYRATFGQRVAPHTQFNVFIPVQTTYTGNAPPKTGLAQIGLYVARINSSDRFSHTLACELRLPTVTNGVRSNDTQLRPRYDLRWMAPTRSLTFENTFAQSIIVPPGSKWTSYYDFKIAGAPHTQNSAIAAFYEGRFLFTNGGMYVSAIGPTLVGQQRERMRLSVYDLWGIGAHGQTYLWRYKFQANLTVKF